MEKIKHKQQKLNSEEKSIVKDQIFKKCFWFYKFEDIFYKHPIIFPPFLIKSEQPLGYQKVNINDSKLRGFDFDLEKILKAHRKIEDTELGLLLGNHNGNNNMDSNLCFVFSQIAKNEQQNKIQK